MKFLRTLPVILNCFLAAASVQAMSEEDAAAPAIRSPVPSVQDMGINALYMRARNLIRSEDNGKQQEGARMLAAFATLKRPYLPAVNLLLQRLSKDCPFAIDTLDTLFTRDIEARVRLAKNREVRGHNNRSAETPTIVYGRAVLAAETAYLNTPARYQQHEQTLRELLVPAEQARTRLQNEPGLRQEIRDGNRMAINENDFVADSIGSTLLNTNKAFAVALFEEIAAKSLWENAEYADVMHHYAHSLLIGLNSEGANNSRGVRRALEIIRAGIKGNAPNTESFEKLLFQFDGDSMLYDLTRERLVRSRSLRTRYSTCMHIAHRHAADILEKMRKDYIALYSTNSTGVSSSGAAAAAASGGSE